jgi:hypothetical protein
MGRGKRTGRQVSAIIALKRQFRPAGNVTFQRRMRGGWRCERSKEATERDTVRCGELLRDGSHDVIRPRAVGEGQ